jgi:pimeloyl-ACP methyl ester carboxylesterase
MATVINLLSWIFCLVFAVVSLLVFGMGGRLQFFLILCIALILAPPIRQLIQKAIHFEIPWWGFLIVGVVLWAGVMLSFVIVPAESIYKSERYKEKLNEIYDAKLAAWPVPYESIFIDTPYGKIHVIVSGNEHAPAILLINASALSGWSWIHNVQELSKEYRTYAIDNIGEGGKNEMLAPGTIPNSGKEIAEFYTGICDQLGIQKAHVIGASIGGFISTNIALHATDRVNKLVLLGSMGYGSTNKTVIAMTLAQGFPIKPVQEATFKWAFGDDEAVNNSFGEWFRIYMKGLVPIPIKPRTFSPVQLEQLKVPTLAYFGTNDGVIGDAEAAKTLAQNIPDVEIRIVESGHVIGAELSYKVNHEILEFFRAEE